VAKERVGFIGVGFMGHGMAKNIVEKGHALTIMGHRNRKPVEDLIERGATEAKTPAEVAQASDIVFLCVTGSPQVEALVRGENGLAAGARARQAELPLIIADCSTAEPTSTLALAAELAPQNVYFVDAPLGGTPTNAWEGKLSTMIGAEEAIFERVQRVAACFAAKIEHIGSVGDGHKMKLLNNFLSLGYAAIYSEALALAQKVGISPKVFDSVLRGSRMDCGFYQTFFKYVLERDRDAHKFTLNNALKDMRYLAAMADSAEMANPVGSAVKNSFAQAVATGHGEDYVPMLSDFVATESGTKLA
jgi:3-hydroxyisobutyrate dehydrogenase-like beta-hydroxyacid dehydrogenase